LGLFFLSLHFSGKVIYSGERSTRNEKEKVPDRADEKEKSENEIAKKEAHRKEE